MQSGTLFLPFPETVSRLFKVKDLGSEASNPLMHAAIGISGEVAELQEVQTYSNLVEELGDLNFYIEAARQQLPTHNGMPSYGEFTLGNFHSKMGILAGEFLDLVKKQWVYGKELDPVRAHILLNVMQTGVHFYASIISVDMSFIVAENQRKLGTRYPEGVYTDFHAVARQDKAEETSNVTG